MSIKDTDFMSEIDAVMREKPARPAVWMLILMSVFIVFFLIWAGITQVEEVTRGEGAVVPSREVQIVQSLEGGVLQEILVAKGDLVKKGQVLMRISDVQFSSEERGTQAQFLGLQAKRARLIAEANGKDFTIPQEIIEKAPKIAANERELYATRQKELQAAFAIQDENIKKAQADLDEVKAQIGAALQSMGHLNKELAITRDMVAKRAVPKLEQIRLERQVSDLQGQVNAKRQEQAGLEATLSGAQSERGAQSDKFKSVALEELNTVETQISALQENLKSMGDRVDRTELRAPVDGVVNDIMLRTVGGVVEPAMKLVEIVPVDDELKIIAKVKPDEIAFLQVGQPVKVKVTAYDPQKYGALDGTLTRVAANSTQDRDGNIQFEIEVRTARNFLGSADAPLPITIGMIAHVEVITGKRTILNYMLKPLRRGFERALRER